MGILRGQSDVSAQVPMPTDRADDGAVVINVSGETLTWLYVNNGAWASATGQAAGTLVYGNLGFRSVINSNKGAVGSYNNTSFSLGASTRLDTLVSIPDEVFAKMQFLSPADQKAEALLYLTTQGYYAIDHRRGQIWGRPKATVADDAATYSYMASTTGGGLVASSNITQVGGVAVPTAGADAVSNTRSDIPTSARISGFNGTTWDRIKAGITTVTSTLTGWLNTLPWAIYNASQSTRTEAQGGPLQADSLGNLNTNLYTKVAGEDVTNDVMKVEQQMTYTHITLAAPTTTVVKSGAGLLHAVTINQAVATGVITIYDNTAASGTVIAVITQPAAVLATTQVVLYDVKFATGCTIVTATAAQDITVSTR